MLQKFTFFDLISIEKIRLFPDFIQLTINNEQNENPTISRLIRNSKFVIWNSQLIPGQKKALQNFF